MRITRKSRTTSGRDHPFRSRFDGAEGLFPLRQMLRCRDELVHRVILSVVQSGFLVALALMGWSLHKMFLKHGDRAPGWVEPLLLAAVLFVMVLVGRRIVRNVREALELRLELRRLRAEVRRLQDDA